MTEKKELNNEELNQVSGGAYGYEKYRKQYTIKIDKKDIENYIGQNLYFDFSSVDDYHWVCGTLVDSYEKSHGCGTTRIAKIAVIEACGYLGSSSTQELSIDSWRVYRK